MGSKTGAAGDGSEVDVGLGGSGSDADTSDQDGSNPYVLNGPDGSSSVNPEEPNCGARSFEAEQVVVETEVEVAEEITEEITEEIPEEVSEEVTTVKPASLYILFDRSQSMAGATGNGDLWTPAVKAVRSFVNDPASAGLGVGIQYFPISNDGCSDGKGYKTPSVMVAALPGNAKAISDSLGMQSPSGFGTPVEGALRGATQYCLSFQALHPGEQCVAVLVTDGEPEYRIDCETDYDKIAAIATAAKAKGVITFAVGLKGANFTLLDKIAREGGAPDCDTGSTRYSCDVSGGAAKLSEALSKIRETVVTIEKHTITHTVTHTETRTVTHTEYRTEVQKTSVPCEWTIPESTDGPLDRDRLNVRWSVKDERKTLLRVGSEADCRARAWYYDNPTNPQRVIACGQTCDEIKAEVDSTIDILLGCATIVPG